SATRASPTTSRHSFFKFGRERRRQADTLSVIVSLDSPFKEASQLRGWNTEAVLRDYRIAFRSRRCSVVARREVFSGKAKFGIFGEGKESAQLAMAYAFRKGDFRSGYYRDQTLMFALDLLTVEQFFAQLYAHADVAAEPASGG